MNDMKRLLSYAGPYKRDMIFGAVLVLVETCFELFIPILISNLIDVGVANGDIPYIYRKGIQMGICALFALITGLLYARFAARATYGWGAEIRKAEYAKMQRPPSDKGKRLRIYYTTQVSVKPPTFVIFVNDKQLMHFSYTRYLENRIRETFGFRGTALRFIIRERKENEK